jgi:hypothetical protein
MITHIPKSEREVIEQILPLLDDVPFTIIGPAITKLLGLVIVGAHDLHPDSDVWKVFNGSMQAIRDMIEAHLADQADTSKRKSKSTN